MKRRRRKVIHEMEPDPSARAPVVKWSEQWWANASPEVQAHRCTAHSSRTGERCKL